MRFRYVNSGSVRGAVNVDCIAVVQSIANLGASPPAGLGGLLTNTPDGTAVVSASAWPDDDPTARLTVQMPHVVVKVVQLLDGDTSKPLEPGPHVPDVRNDYFQLREKSFIQT
ncbi:hypothetical protein D7V93_11040 [Corallococcus llansteffanensis]|uniref:Uncharacterized protein n=1 Tax=Corallococcus llansteffanensis TaxID=2316731 RepID=A0A3A8PZH6_9BACT|nr:hypothetical protein D7V93_11040 [Corallococcus llansteffanensis]